MLLKLYLAIGELNWYIAESKTESGLQTDQPSSTRVYYMKAKLHSKVRTVCLVLLSVYLFPLEA